VARFSNDQFVVVVEDLDDGGDAVELAIRVIEAINEPFMIGADEAFVNASVGIAFAPNGLGTAESLVGNADVAMGRAKDGSVTRYEVYDLEMRAWVEAQRKTEIALRHGIDRSELELFYQPVVALDGGEINGVEALVRWNHPQRGRLLPKDFMSIAEDSGLIVPMGEQILREAIAQSARWNEMATDRPMSVAINLSAPQLAHPALVDVVRSALDDAGADPSRVELEITETVVLDDVDAVVGTLGLLKDLGVRISLDDFGTGYSSLTHLCRLPIDTVKVDRSFVSQLGTGTRDASIVEMVVTMARTLRLDVVAEGVETEQQAAMLRHYGCPFAQGFLFSEPVPAAHIDRCLREARVAGVASQRA
jgi:predicted signal transduction protein with EAL and GGDEF domain